MEQQLLTIFVQGVWEGSILPFSDQNTLFAMFSFQSANLPYAIIAATIGNMLGFAFNWYIGNAIRHTVFKNQHKPKLGAEEELSHATLLQGIRRFGWIALLFVWVPLGNFLTIAAAVFRISLDKTILAAGFGMALFYVYQAGYVGF